MRAAHLAGPDRGPERLRPATRLVPVTGLLGRGGALGQAQPWLGGERLGHRDVQVDLGISDRRPVHRLAQQRMPEPVHVLVVPGDQHLPVETLLQRVVQHLAGQPADRTQQLPAHRTAGDRGHPQHLERRPGRGRPAGTRITSRMSSGSSTSSGLSRAPAAISCSA